MQQRMLLPVPAAAAALLACAALLPRAAGAFTADVGQVAVIEDTGGQIHAGVMVPPAFCREAAKVFYATHADDFDSIIAFTTKRLDFLSNVYQGTPVRNDASGTGMILFDHTAAYGSAGRLRNCIKMGMISGLPDDPDGTSAATYNLTGVEILAHEYSHLWLLWMNYDTGDGSGERDLLRGYENDSPNGHWNYYSNSGSVMYGNCVTELGGGQFRLSGCPRGYNDFDLYAMGMLDAAAAGPLWLVDTGDPHGAAVLPLKNGRTATAAGTRVDVTIADVVRVHGPRVPAAADAPHRFRVAFVLVSEAGIDADAALIGKVDRYRLRFEGWFGAATRGVGSLDTRLVVDESEEGEPEAAPEEAEEPRAEEDGEPAPADGEDEGAAQEEEPAGDAAETTDGDADGLREEGGGCGCRISR